MGKKESISLVDELRRDPVEFVRQVLREEPHIGQVELLRGMKPYTSVRAGRRWGKSVSLGWYICWLMTTHPGFQVILVAPTIDQAKIIFGSVRKAFLRAPLNRLITKITTNPFPEIYTKNGASLLCRGSNNPDYLRGKTAHRLIVDEASFTKDYTFSDVLLPMLGTTIDSGNDCGLTMISTPFGGGFFQERSALWARLEAEGQSQYATFHYRSSDNPYVSREFLKEQCEHAGGEESLLWRTEYLAEFADSDLSVFKTNDILAACEAFPDEHFPLSPLPGHRYAQGVDLANLRDFFVASMMDITHHNMCILSRMDRHQNKGYGFYKDLIRRNYRDYNSCQTMIDATSLGSTVSDDLVDIRAEGYAIGSNVAKWDLVQELARMFQERRIAIPRDPDTLKELRYFSYEVTKSKTIKMEASRGHDDIVMSLAFCAALANRPQYTGFFKGLDLSHPNRVSRSHLQLLHADSTDDQAYLLEYIRKINNGEPVT